MKSPTKNSSPQPSTAHVSRDFRVRFLIGRDLSFKLSKDDFTPTLKGYSCATVQTCLNFQEKTERTLRQANLNCGDVAADMI